MKPTPRELLEAAARSRVPDNLNLYPRLSAQLERKTLMQTLRAKPLLLVLSVLLALGLLTGVAYAVGRLTGFIPGFGFTGDASTVYVLTEPAEVEQEGMTLGVENAVSAEDKLWISFSVENGKLDPEQRFTTGAIVILPDGNRIRFQAAREDGLDTDQRTASYEFPALPVGTETLTLHYDVSTEDGTVLWSVEVPVKLRPIRTDEVIPTPQAYAAPLQSETHDGLTLVLDHVATASDKTILQVSLRFDQPGTSLNAPWGVTLIGDDGTVFPLTDVISDFNNRSRTFETLPFHGGENLTLTLAVFPDAQNLPMSVDFPVEQATFTFDPGADPRPGQHWKLDEQVQPGQYLIHVISATQVSETELRFEFAPTPGVTGAMLYSPLASGATGSLPFENTNFTASLFFDKIPAQPFTVSVTRVGYTARGRWQIQ